MGKKWSIILHSAFFLFCIVLSVLIFSHWVSGRNLHISYVSDPAPESSQVLENPYCGFYQMNGYILSDDQTSEDALDWYQKNCASNPYPLLLLEINLKNYADASISSVALKQLRTLLKACSDDKKQVILRFLYDWDGQALSTEPTELYRIKNHIQQFSSVVNVFSDCVYILQGTLTGNNGEMNNSNYNDINQIRQIAEDIGLQVAHKADSQEICFIPDNDYAGFIEREAENVPGPGNFVTADGTVIGRHEGITHYTIGQRKGLNLAMGHPVFVTEIRPETNEVVIGEAGDVFTDSLVCNKLNWMAVDGLHGKPMEVSAKIRYSHKGAPCVIEEIGEDLVQCRFSEPVRAVTPGQAVVFYDGDYVVGGGTIIR